MTMISQLKETLQQAIGNTPGAQIDVILTILVVTALWLARRILLRVALRKTDNVHARYRWRKTSAYLAFLVGAVLIVGIWFQGLGSLSTMIGLVSAGVVVTFESNWEKAKGILSEIVTRHAEHLSTQAERRVREASMKFMIFYSKLTPIVYTSVEDCGVLLTLRYLTEPQKRRGRLEAIWEDILRAFAEHDDIDFAYPTQRFYVNSHEGKPGTVKAPPVTEQPRDPLGV